MTPNYTDMRVEELSAQLTVARREIEQLREDAKITRQLLLGAALDSIYENLLGMDQSLPPLMELSQDIKEYWIGLVDTALQSGALSAIDVGAINRVHEQLSLALPQYS